MNDSIEQSEANHYHYRMTGIAGVDTAGAGVDEEGANFCELATLPIFFTELSLINLIN